MQFDVRAFELEGLLDRLPAGVEILSLDCFDTVIWRTTNAPVDVFAELSLPGSSMGGRILAEDSARRRAYATTGAKEIGLRDVYDFLYPFADDETIEQAVAHELKREREHAIAFAPAIALIRQAKRRGLKVVIVSDMYWSEPQLRAHIAAIAGEDVLAEIDHVFVSSSYGVGKCNGLFKHVLKTLKVAPDRILHLGDNRAADFDAPHALGIHAVHFRQFENEAEQRFRMEAAAAIMLDPSSRATRAICQAHRAQIAVRGPCDPASALGHDVVGPVMHNFAFWLNAELETASAAIGRPVKPLFVMRDGFLPFLVFDKMYPGAGAAKVELSRFVSYRASIKDAATLDNYLAEWAMRLPVEMMASQLMLLPHEYARFTKGGTEEYLRSRFARAVRSNDFQRKIVQRCRAFTEKMVAHLTGLGVAQGDAVMLIDIGYNGTVQNIITPILHEYLGLDVIGRYLFLREAQVTGLDKRGMIDVRNYDFRALHALSSSVVVIEQLCNIAQGSTIDFTADGAPVREAVDAKAAHSKVRSDVQAACLAYVEQAGRDDADRPASDTLESRARAAAAALARLFFLPSATEVNLFATFDFDLNMGTAVSRQLIDQESSSQDLRRHGVSFGASRKETSFLSAELQSQGLPTGIGMFAAARFNLDLRVTDYQSGGIEVPVITIAGSEHLLRDYTAWRTVDGYYRLQIPMGASGFGIGIQLGKLCSWAQIEALEVTPIADLGASVVEKRVAAVKAMPDGMEEVAPGLYQLSPEGLLFAAQTPFAEPVMLSLVFRPIRGRDDEIILKKAA